MADYGDPAYIRTDLAQLFRRVAFNVAVGNRDDHLRNHGFILERQGWRLAPAFDLNPNIDKDVHVLNIDEVDNRPSLTTVLNTAEYYRLRPGTGQAILDEIIEILQGWSALAERHGLSVEERLETARAFEAIQH